MRLAKPIYSKKGVLLYDRASVLKDMQSIENIKSFGLIGLFILEPAEPVPPMTQDDLDFERFQTVMYNEIVPPNNIPYRETHGIVIDLKEWAQHTLFRRYYGYASEVWRTYHRSASDKDIEYTALR